MSTSFSQYVAHDEHTRRAGCHERDDVDERTARESTQPAHAVAARASIAHAHTHADEQARDDQSDGRHVDARLHCLASQAPQPGRDQETCDEQNPRPVHAVEAAQHGTAKRPGDDP
jgi:hypothetical protein